MSDIRVSRFIFGTASLFNAGNAIRRRRILESAIDNGFTHFDTAPYYGFGMAERDLAPVLKTHPGVSFTTKVGLYSPGGENQPYWAVFARKAAGRLAPSVSRPALDFSIRRAQTALEGSLRRTGRNAVDIYLLHDPTFELVNTDEWLRWLEACTQSGKVRHFGLALTADMLRPFLQAHSGLCRILQVLDSLDGREADILGQFGKPLQITYGYVSDAFKRGGDMTVTQILKKAMARCPHSAIIVSTTRPERMAQYASIPEATA
ncbi:aldo/keto reductase [Variovorax sp. J22R133]|uniref:aldo/keto reductase n=1 Tax=Variovorax brevis TaxID=3053503 RepID=UPI0025749DF3|nr:aldo/keto reductase [Variovorax sp. J22R133]MDM0112746.1 aldo/keto reductase [Variovorax sp. J22R133]